jgi:hypothetical protein
MRFAWSRFASLRFASLRFAPLRSASMSFASLRFALVRFAPPRSAPRWNDVGVFITPCVPGSHALLEQCDVFVVRHESTSNSGAAPNDSTVRTGVPQEKGFRFPPSRPI